MIGKIFLDACGVVTDATTPWPFLLTAVNKKWLSNGIDLVLDSSIKYNNNSIIIKKKELNDFFKGVTIIMVETIAVLVVCHMIGDYVLQSNYIATTKGENWYHLFVHCALYLVPFYIYFGFTWQLAIVFISHMIIDPLKARYNKINYWQDQVLHYIVCALYLI